MKTNRSKTSAQRRAASARAAAKAALRAERLLARMKPINEWLAEAPRSAEHIAAYHKIRDGLIEVAATMRSQINGSRS